MDTSKDPVEFRRYDFLQGNGRQSVVLAFSEAALKELAADPVDKKLSGRALVFELEDRGVVLQDVIDADGNLIPSEQYINEKQNARIITHRMKDGKEGDPAPGEPGWERTDLKSGLVIAAKSMKNDRFYTEAELAELNASRRILAALPGVKIPGAKLPPQP